MPVEGVDLQEFLTIEASGSGGFVKVGADEGVPTFDVIAKVGEGPLLEQTVEAVERLLGLALEHLEEQGEFGHLHGLRIDVHAIDVGEEDPLPLGGGQAPLALTLPSP